jgi:hypothetical protein
MTKEWLDRLAIGVAERKISRRVALVAGVRAVLAGGVLGGALRGLDPTGAAHAADCGEISDNCRAVGEAAQQTADAACGAELPANQPACYAQAASVGAATTLQCALTDRKNACGPCAVCVTGGYCQPLCPADCQQCDPSTHRCHDTCAPDQYCSAAGGRSEANGECVPKCPANCAPYDPSTGGCRDRCAESNPCMVCKQGYCQSNCPNKADFCDSDGVCKPCDFKDCRHIDPDGVCRGCDPNCERCKDGACVSSCPSGQVCCAGGCIDCCDGTCDIAKGICVGGGILCPNGVCCPADTHCCYDAPAVGGGKIYLCCPDGQRCCAPGFARCGC